MYSSKAKCPLPRMYTEDSTEINKIVQVKENIPPKVMNSFFLQNELSSFIKVTPKKSKKHAEEPLTPNTNFKLLTTLAAERDYANCTTPKSGKPLNTSPSDDNPVLNKKDAVIRTTRKEKSLSIICTRFLDMYPLYPTAEQKCIISLDEACMKLGIERRRLYDIVNVFESINMLNKLSKNKYIWFGKNKLEHSLQNIKVAAKNENILAKLQYVLDHEGRKPDYKQSCILNEVADFSKQLENKNASSFSSETLECGNFPELRKEKSLAFMSQRFLMLFLVSPFKIISLGVAAKVLNGFQKNDGGAQMKTHIRRLYDIANVLSSIGLIKKEVTFNQNGRKPAFKYIGPGAQDSQEVENHISISTPKKRNTKSKSFTRHSSFQEICAVAEMEHRKLFFDETPNSAPPFENNLISKNESRAISFSNLDFNNSLVDTKTQSKEEYTQTKDEMKKMPLQNVALNKLADSKSETKVPEKPALMPLQSNMTMINVPSGIFTGNNSCYILSPVTRWRGTNSIGTFLLFTPPGSSYKPMIEDKKSSKNEPKEVPEQKNTIKKSSIDTLQSKTIFQPSDIQRNLSQNLLILNEKPNQASFEQIKSSSNDILANNMESNESSVCSTRNNSPTSSTSRFDSPFSIPSGYATPVPNVSSDISFPSCVETSTILKNIENCVDSTLLIKPENISLKSTSEERSDIRYLTNNYVEKNSLVLKDLIPNTQDKERKSKVPCGNNSNGSLKEIQNFSYLNSCSNDSLNSEVFEILKGKKLGDSTKKHLLFDENTVSSPIKKIKKEAFSPNLIPSAFITPPCVPEKVFVFNTASYQSTAINAISFPRLLKIKSTTNKNNLFPS